MKWKLLLALSFCFSLLIPITTNATTLAPTGTGTTAKVVRTGMVWKGGKWVVNHVAHHKLGYASLAVVGGVYYFRKDIDELVDKYMTSDKWSSEKKSILVPKLTKKINNAKTQDQAAVIVAIQNSLMHYMVMYEDESLGRTATDIITALDLRTGEFLKNYDIALAAKKTAVSLITVAMTTTIANIQKTNCMKGSYNREYIKQKQDNSSSNTTLEAWDVGPYEKQKKITDNYNKLRKTNGKSLYDFHKDHIPSKKAVLEYLKKRDKMVVTPDIVKNINNNATSVVMIDTKHRIGRTYGQNNKKFYTIDSMDLELAMKKDFVMYYILFTLSGEVNKVFDVKFVSAYIETYVRNERLCLFRRR